jgi:hypothetical protein
VLPRQRGRTNSNTTTIKNQMNKKIVKISVSIIVAILAIEILWSILPTLAIPVPSAVKNQLGIVSLTGTIRKLAIEGTCYQLAADNGKKYELMGKFPKIDGTRVEINGVIASDVVTICQVGKVVKVKSVRVLK